jgi:hypothetical protein
MAPETKTLTFTNAPSESIGAYGTVNGLVKIIDTGSFVVTYPASVTWVNGITPTTAHVATLVSFDGGTTWKGTYAS